MPSADRLARVRRATARRARAEEEWRAALKAARQDGMSLRQIATAAGVSHVRVQQLTGD